MTPCFMAHHVLCLTGDYLERQCCSFSPPCIKWHRVSWSTVYYVWQVIQVATRQSYHYCWTVSWVVRIAIWALRELYVVRRWCLVSRLSCVLPSHWMSASLVKLPSLPSIIHGNETTVILYTAVFRGAHRPIA